ncbi:hypothetical protein B0H14DRAFT_3124391 [Mycena olivaceomarginata]|nr:hypothetical protein B0H14DRAFT_3124391 [Mycena olivaceomarginata]
MPSLPDLPTELLMEIVKCYPELLSEVDACLHGVHIDQFDGNDVLRTLSQTCRALRNIFFPVLWTRVRATFNARILAKRNKMRTRTTMLERRMRGILTTPYVVPYIRSLSITVDECKKGDWRPMAAFIRVLDLLPRLQSLTILGISMESMNAAFELPWAKKVYPSIVALALPDDLAPILHCFLNVQTLTMSNRWYSTYRPISGKLFSAARNRCKAIHTVNNLAVSAEAIKSLRESIPTVQHLSIWENVCWKLDILPLLEGMDNLSDLRVRCRAPRLNDWLEETISAAKRILQTSKASRQKELRIQHLEDTRPDDLVIREETLFVVGASQ